MQYGNAVLRAGGKAYRRRKSSRLRDLRRLLAEIVESSSDAVFSRKLDGTVSTWNAAAERLFGYRAQEIIGQPSATLLPSDRPDELRRMMERVRRGEHIRHFETVRLRKDGRPLAVSLSLSPLRNASGRVVGAATIARDISVERENEARILEISEREQQRLGRDLHDGLGQQLGGVELLSRTLVAELSKRRRPETRLARLVVEQVQNALAQTRALARGLTPVMDSPKGLMLALEHFSATTGSLFGIHCSFQCEQPVLIHDHIASVHLFRIAQEAVANALRHGDTRRLEIVLARRGSALIVQIRDQGKGLPPDWQKSLGLGIRIMQYRTSLLEGSICWRKAKPRGVVVTCMVPLPTPIEAP